ncbi:transposase [Cyanobium sp. NIES-981]|uniref:transposase n=1 Tax=Cyanobium sp. NIES-981 TaxID=1851505 RepID=UPI0007DD1FD2|nr:protein of unknown function [Cyanobium sp. NIES-981]
MRVLSRPDWAVDSTIKRTRHAAEQIIRKLKTAEQLIAQGKTVADVCRVIEVTQPTYHRWWQQYGGCRPRRPGGCPSWRRSEVVWFFWTAPIVNL